MRFIVEKPKNKGQNGNFSQTVKGLTFWMAIKIRGTRQQISNKVKSVYLALNTGCNCDFLSTSNKALFFF